jgi:Flp pilus assembly protein TadG
MKRRQRGIAVVEFAIIGVLLMIVIFGVIETGRALFIVNTLTEATRRGARMATVCPVNDSMAARVAVFDNGGGGSAVVHGLTTANVVVEYLNTAGNVIADPANNFSSIRYVRVRIVNFTQSFIIPFIMPSVSLAGFSTTLPRESLGIPRAGVVTPC